MSFSLREREFVQSARAIGSTNARLIWLHILPNSIAPLIVATTLAVGHSILVELALSFLGFGVHPPTPSWGNLLNEARQWLDSAPWLAIAGGHDLRHDACSEFRGRRVAGRARFQELALLPNFRRPTRLHGFQSRVHRRVAIRDELVMEIPIVACPCGARFTDCLLTEPVHDPSSWKYRVACSLAPDATGAETAFFRIESAHFGKRPSPRVKADIRQHRTRITTLHVFQHDLGFDPRESRESQPPDAVRGTPNPRRSCRPRGKQHLGQHRFQQAARAGTAIHARVRCAYDGQYWRDGWRGSVSLSTGSARRH